MRLNKSKYFLNGTLPFLHLVGNAGRREKLIPLHVRPLGYPTPYGGYSRVYSGKSNTSTLSAPGHDPNLDTVVHERTAGVSLCQTNKTFTFVLENKTTLDRKWSKMILV